MAAALCSTTICATREDISIASTRRPVTPLDPLEDFVTTHRQGHCEYFAGALAMMLRSVGIPARLALGFKGGQWNSLGNYYQVQQLHAHAWVEVYLAEDEIPDAELDADGTKPPAAWLTLDPTEGTREADAGDGDRRLLTRAAIRRLRPGVVEQLRVRHELQSAAAGNLRAAGARRSTRRRKTFSALKCGKSACAGSRVRISIVFGSGIDGIGLAGGEASWRPVFRWRLVALYQAGRRLAAPLAAAGLLRVAFVRRAPGFGNVSSARGGTRSARLRRRPAQTAYEFAVEAGGDLSESLEYRRVAHLPRKIVEAFYRVRFGNRTLDNREANAVEHALVELELALGRLR